MIFSINLNSQKKMKSSFIYYMLQYEVIMNKKINYKILFYIYHEHQLIKIPIKLYKILHKNI